jgi:hypothetical protein
MFERKTKLVEKADRGSRWATQGLKISKARTP